MRLRLNGGEDEDNDPGDVDTEDEDDDDDEGRPGCAAIMSCGVGRGPSYSTQMLPSSSPMR